MPLHLIAVEYFSLAFVAPLLVNQIYPNIYTKPHGILNVAFLLGAPASTTTSEIPTLVIDYVLTFGFSATSHVREFLIPQGILRAMLYCGVSISNVPKVMYIV